MKKIANYLIALAVMAFTFTSCEDVPSPFGDIVKPASEEAVVIEPKGSGAESDPYNVAALLEFVSGLGADTPSDKEVYFQGYVTETTDISAQYGNATFYISDNAEGTANKFYVFRAKGLGGENVTDEKFLKVGDFVVMCGKVTNYKGNTPETVQGAAYVVSINGEGGGGTKPDTPTGDAKGSGTLDDPYNAAGANKYIASLAADKDSDKDIYIKGKLVKYAKNGEFSAQYGNASFYISEDGTESSEQFYVFRTLYLGNKKYTEGETPKVGDEVVICGKVVNYKGNTPETVTNKSYIYSLNGKTADGGGDTPTPSGEAKGTGTQTDPFNAAAANAYIKTLAADTKSESDFYIKGKIVKYANNGEFSTQYGNASFYISDNGTEDGEQFYVFRTLYLGNVKYTEGDTPKVGDEVVICGKVVNYKGNTPETSGNESYIFSWNGSSSGGGNNGGGDTSGTGTQASPLSSSQVYDAVAAMEKGVTSSEDYWVKGKICSIKYSFSADYGTATFNITDDGTPGSKEFTAYSTYYHAQDQKWTESDSKYCRR